MWIDRLTWTLIVASSLALAISTAIIMGGFVAHAITGVGAVLFAGSLLSRCLRAPRSRRLEVMRALFGAVACVIFMFLSATVVSRTPMADEPRERLVLMIFSPLLLVTRALGSTIDYLGPQGLAEPASHYLPGWGVWALSVLSCAILVALVAGVALVTRRVAQAHRASIGERAAT